MIAKNRDCSVCSWDCLGRLGAVRLVIDTTKVQGFAS